MHPQIFLESPFQLLKEIDEGKENYQTKYNWDLSYESVEAFLTKLHCGDLRALGRFVQVEGMMTSSKILGERVFNEFEAYKKFILPVKRKRMEVLWKNLKNLGLISQKKQFQHP